MAGQQEGTQAGGSGSGFAASLQINLAPDVSVLEVGLNNSDY